MVPPTTLNAFTAPTSSLISTIISTTPMNYFPTTLPSAVLTTAAYLAVTNMVYLARRSYLRKMSVQRLWQIRTTREPGVNLQLYVIILLAWQAHVMMFPIVEPIARCLGQVSFFYSYPNASGVGIIFEPRNVQHMTQSQRAKHQIRCDWHRFNVNVGGIGRDGYRHPPSITKNVPHIDMPKRNMKHWPWRRRWKNNKDKKV